MTLLIILVARLALGRELHLHPILDRHDGRIRFPIGLSLLNDLEGLAEPIHRLANELIGGHAGLHAAFAVR